MLTAVSALPAALTAGGFNVELSIAPAVRL